ncbi:interferon-induced gtp-binding mx [Fusarium beomiforme]|uniref:Interferon-induced gtp-binding mx n=1 Tax=Fusarium beomiforme TaxID=44412 RepID=A0A9P5E194_9HYPO|nr:interferon-induced gtp-binding mx [Fusarium beomiforme]
MTTSKAVKSEQGLGNRALLDKMDKLRELDISNMVPLPQMVVVGDQSAGKSSVLESLTGFHFPRAVSLCTRHATEIICRREETESIVVSIRAVDADKEEAKAFRRTATKLDGEEFAKIFEDAAKVMGINTGKDGNSSGSAFSRDVLCVEISGPDEDHLTVIDVPGMFEYETEGITTKEDIKLVKDMVRVYIKEPRTIILAVAPCNVDVANQKILMLAKEVDPGGKRTLGVLTKPDLLNENATRAAIVDLVCGKGHHLKLGYCIVRNRGADDTSSSAKQRDDAEKEFFSNSPWTKISPDRLGIPALKARLRHLQGDLIKSELPKVRTDMTTKQKEYESILESMGESRFTEAQQRIYLGKIAEKFALIKGYGLDAYYTRHPIFENEDLKLITRIREINEAFGKVVYERGHTRNFSVPVTANGDGSQEEEEEDDDEDDGQSCATAREDLYESTTFSIPLLGEDDLLDILSDMYWCPDPSDEDILSYIENEYLTSRGYEIGTFNSELLPTTFKEQCKKWRPMARAHVSNAILVVHHFIRTVLDFCCPDESIRTELWSFLLEDLQERYRRAVRHVEFLLEVEFEGKSITYDPEFNESLNRLKYAHVEGLAKEVEKSVKGAMARAKTDAAAASEVRQLVESRLNKETTLNSTRRDIHNVLQTFYKNARTRFVDVVCQQVIDHFLLHAPDGPLSVLSQDLALRMTAEELEAIAGEDILSKDRREKLNRDVANLKEGLKILRG